MTTSTPQDPKQALTTLRIIWFALLMGQVLFFAVVIFLIRQAPAEPTIDAQTSRLVFYIAAAMLVLLVPVGYLIRAKTYDRARGGDGSVAPGAYVTGNIILLAMCEGASLLSIVGMLLARNVMPFIIVMAIAVVVQLINFPTGGPLRQP